MTPICKVYACHRDSVANGRCEEHAATSLCATHVTDGFSGRRCNRPVVADGMCKLHLRVKRKRDEKNRESRDLVQRQRAARLRAEQLAMNLTAEFGVNFTGGGDQVRLSLDSAQALLDEARGGVGEPQRKIQDAAAALLAYPDPDEARS
jgi:hypothetical protein